MARMNVSLDDAILDDIVRMVPRRKRSEFVIAAVKEKLERLAQEKGVRESAGAWSDEGRDDPSVEVRKLRAGWMERRPRLNPRRKRHV